MEKSYHFLILCYPAQGLINPTLQLAKQLARGGALVTFATTVHALTRIKSFRTHQRLSYASFSDGYDDGPPNPRQDSIDNILARAKQVGSATLSDLLNRLSTDGNPATMLIYTIILPWAAAVARDFNLPTAFFFAQSATSFAMYQKYFQLDFTPEISSIKLPGLPSFSSGDIPTFLLPTDMLHFLTPIFKQHMQILEQDPDSVVLINTFNGLEEESIDAIDYVKMIPIGPLIPSAFSDETEPSDRAYGVDLFVESESESHDYLKWLNMKQGKSVIYVSFGSLATLKKRQVKEVMNGLIDSNREFLWVMRSVDSDDELEIKSMVGDHGLVVPWCCQVEVLSHGSVGCFVTHCGWNSTTESITAGVPMVACPQFSDQVTNAKMVEDVWKVGVKAVAAEADGEMEMVVGREEIKRCLEIVMGSGERGDEIRRNVGKWRDLALNALKEGGSSHKNLKEFLGRI